MINREQFYTKIKEVDLFKKIYVPQVEGIEAILNEWEVNKFLVDTRWLAYILATVYHETGKTMQPIEEYGKGKGKPYGQKLKYGGGPGKRVPYSKPDKIYFGRGHTQNTWFEIYDKLTKANKNGWDFLNNPELLLSMRPSVWATFYGMTTGLYTGKKLADYFDNKKEDWFNARRIINGVDKAELIAGYGRGFYDCLT